MDGEEQGDVHGGAPLAALGHATRPQVRVLVG